MKITIDETGKQFRVNDERVNQVFDDVKENALEIIQSYGEDEKDVTAAVLGLYAIACKLKSNFEDMFGHEEIIRVLGALEVK